MENALKPINEILTLHNKLFKIATSDVSEEDANKRINGKGNPFIHLAGHVTATRFFIGGLLGLQEENPLGEVFDGKYEPKANRASLKEILEVFDKITPKLMNQLGKVGAGQLSSDLPKPFPVEEQTILSGVTFLAEHEGYHLGQMGYLRVQLGYKAIYEKMFADA